MSHSSKFWFHLPFHRVLPLALHHLSLILSLHRFFFFFLLSLPILLLHLPLICLPLFLYLLYRSLPHSLYSQPYLFHRYLLHFTPIAFDIFLCLRCFFSFSLPSYLSPFLLLITLFASSVSCFPSILFSYLLSLFFLFTNLPFLRSLISFFLLRHHHHHRHLFLPCYLLRLQPAAKLSDSEYFVDLDLSCCEVWFCTYIFECPSQWFESGLPQLCHFEILITVLFFILHAKAAVIRWMIIWIFFASFCLF